jgi:preprotein translocase subunit SecG
MGVKQTTDVLEKGTWIFAGVIGVLCLLSTLFISGSSSSGSGALQKVSTTPVSTTPPANASGLGTNPNLQPQTNPTTTEQKTTK